jgi:hypothetical protein
LQNSFSNCACQQGTSLDTPRRSKDSHLRQAWHRPGNTGAQPMHARRKNNITQMGHIMPEIYFEFVTHLNLAKPISKTLKSP